MGSVRDDGALDDTVAPSTELAPTAPPSPALAATLPPEVAPTLPPDAASLPTTKPSGIAFTLPPVAADLYETEREIGRGGMGRVIAARDRRLDRVVALKLLQTSSPDIGERFEREARISARLQHPAIIPIYEAGRLPGGEPFYAMKLVSGRPLDQAFANATTLRERLELLPNLLAVADALAYAHARHIVHRDLKPQNVIVGEFGETVVIDWGLAKHLGDADRVAAPRATSDGDGALTVDGQVMGTPAYMAPEQARGEPVDARADVFAIGAMLYHAMSGRLVYRGKSSGELLASAMRGEPPLPLAALAPDAPADLVAIIEKALAPAPGDRYPTAMELAADLRRFQTGQLVGVHRYSLRELIGRWMRRHRAALAVAGAALVLVSVLTVIGVLRIRDERAEAIRQRDAAGVERTRAEALARAAFEDQGRRELLAGHAARALPSLAKALAIAPEQRTIRLLAAEASRRVGTVAYSAALPEPGMIWLSPDRQRAVVGFGHDQTHALVVLDLVAGRELARHARPTGFLTGRFTPDGTRFVTYADDGLEIYDVATATPRARIARSVHEYGWGIAADGKTLLTISADVEVWDLDTGAPRGRIPNPPSDSGFHTVHAALPDGAFLVVPAAARGRALVLDPSGAIRKRLEFRGAYVGFAGRELASLDDKRLRLLDVERGATRTIDVPAWTRSVVPLEGDQLLFNGEWATISGAFEGGYGVFGGYAKQTELRSTSGQLVANLGAVLAVAPSPSPGQLLVATPDRGLQLHGAVGTHALAGGSCPRPGFRDAICNANTIVAAFSPSGQRIATGDGTRVRLHDAATGLAVGEIDVAAGNVLQVAYVAEHRLAVITDYRNRVAIRVFALEDDRAHVTRTRARGFQPTRTSEVAAAFAGSRAALASTDGALVIDLATGDTHRVAVATPARTVQFATSAVAFDAAGQLLVGTPQGVSRVDPQTGTAGVVARVPFGAVGLELSADRTKLLATGVSGDVVAIDLRTQAATNLGRAHADVSTIPHARLSADGKRALVVGEAMTSANLVDTETGKVVRELAARGPDIDLPIDALAFDGTGARAFAGLRDGSVVLWDLAGTGAPKLVEGRSRAVVYLAVAPAGDRVAASDGEVIRILDVRDARMIAQCEGQVGVDGLAFSPDGELLASAGGGEVRLWDRACAVLAVVPSSARRVAFAPDGRHLIAAGPTDWLMWPLDREPHMTDQLARVPWQLQDGRLVERDLERLAP